MRDLGFLVLLIGSFWMATPRAVAAEVALIQPGSFWKYDDTGSNLGTSWRATSYNDGGWPSGAAQLGYGDNDETTVLSYGSNSSNKRPSYYFRQSFFVSDPASVTALTVRFVRDDGCVVYLNGAEVARSNMPPGTISYSTLASGAVSGSDESAWQQAPVDPALLLTGPNVIAVEIHQSSATSSDMSFDLELLSTTEEGQPPTVTLMSPPSQTVVNTDSVTLRGSASSPAGLASATLYIGGPPGTVTFSGAAEIEDTQLSADQPTQNLGNSQSINVDGENPHAHALIKIPALIGPGNGQVPAGSIVTSAVLGLNCTNPGDTMQVYRLTEDWVEGQATWNQRSNSNAWSSAGADGSGSHAGVSLNGACTSTGRQQIDITPFVQQWSDGAPNYGIVLVDSGTDGIDFDGSESSNPPDLTVVFKGNQQPVQTTLLSGGSASVDFPVTLNVGQTYFWNILATDTDGLESWAATDFELTVNAAAPDQPLLISPSDGSGGVPLSPTLSVAVDNPGGGLLDVTFSHRVPAEEEFTIIALPDTQHYSEAFPAVFTSQTQWIAANKTARNIVFVTHLGDIVEHNNLASEWDRANASMSILDDVVPYGMGPGNHDQPTTLFNQYFPYTRYVGETWYGGHHEDKNDNNYQLFSGGGVDFVIVHLEFCPPSSAITWADAVLKTYPNRTGIITTHGYINASGSRSVGSCSNTQYLWDGLAVPNPNVHFMLCGHVHDEGRRTDTLYGHPVYQMLSDYQDRSSGGEGWLRILRFVPAEGKVYVQTYSPWLNQYEIDANSEFTLDFPMGGGFSEIGAVTVSSGSTASIQWPGLDPSSEHEWQVEVTNSSGISVTGPVWTFTTGSGGPQNEPPVAGNQAVSAEEDTPLGILLSALDSEGGPLTYFVNGQPSHGALSGSAPNLTYQPEANYNGPDSFSFFVNDGEEDSNIATVSIDVQAVNDPPVASGESYTLQAGATLDVGAPGVLGNDADIDSANLTAAVVTGPANGSLSLSANGSFSYTPTAGYSGPDSFTYVAGDGDDISNAATVSLTITPVGPPPSGLIFAADFNAGQDGFSYSDDTFRGTNQPNYASGARVASGGFSGGALSVAVGGVNSNSINNMSGGWARTFTLSAPAEVTLSFRYNLTLSADYDGDEYSQALASVDGALYGASPNDYLAQLTGDGNGGPATTTGWRLFEIPIGTLQAGTHTLVLGGFNNKKTSSNESTVILFDDVSLAAGELPPPPPPPPSGLILAADFNSGEDGFSYSDDTFRGTNQPNYASGSRIPVGGFGGGALSVVIGGVNSNSIPNMSGGWWRTFTLSGPTSVTLSFRYNLTLGANYDEDEFSQALASVDGVLYGVSPNDHVAQLTGDGNGGPDSTTGWQLFEIPIGTLQAGTHTVVLGGFNNQKTSSNESTTILFDDVSITTP